MRSQRSVSNGQLSQKSYSKTGDGEFGNQLQELRIVFEFDELAQLVVAFEAGQKAAELVVAFGIFQTLEYVNPEKVDLKMTTW